MGTIFDQIIRHDAPAFRVWEDDTSVAFLDINPRTEGHTLVIPRLAVSHWTDLSDAVSAHLFWVAKQIATAQIAAFDCARAGLVVAGYHVPHVHLHVFPTTSMADFDFRELPHEGAPIELDRCMLRLRTAIASLGFEEYLPVG